MKVRIFYILLILIQLCYSQFERVKVTGEFKYNYGDRESLIEAKNIAYTMAVRRAIESYETFVTSTSTIKDYQMVKDIIQTISTGYMDDLKIIEEWEKGGTVFCKVEAYISPKAVDNIIKSQVIRFESKEPEGIDENKYFKILSTHEKPWHDGSRSVIIIYKKLVSGGSEPLSRTDFNLHLVMITYFDIDGNPIGGEKHIFEVDLNQNEIRDIKFDIPPNAKSYKIWLLKQ